MSESAFATLRGFIRRPAPIERCELCNTALPAEHQHLIEPANRKLSCACEACAMLFPSHGEKKYKRVPRRIRYLADFQLTDSQWDSLMMPINMAFFFKSTPQGRVVALYPSPAGATESLLSLDTWEDLVLDNPVLEAMGADVEERQDGLKIPGKQSLHGTEIDSFGDHRIAMAFAVAALRAEGETVIKGAGAAVISFPGFFEVLEGVVQR